MKNKKIIETQNANSLDNKVSPAKVIVEVERFPKPICLEQCDLDYTKGYERDIFKTLKAFSDKEAFDSKNPHPLYKEPKVEKYFKKAKLLGAKNVNSIDVKSRNDTKRLFYCISGGVCKILAICSDDSHGG